VLHHELKRQVAELLLEQADTLSVDMIAAGSARLSRVDRWMLGSVTTDLVRDGKYSVLVVPPAGTRTPSR
jgi:nucleotide-binding universal stress UspA family protein